VSVQKKLKGDIGMKQYIIYALIIFLITLTGCKKDSPLTPGSSDIPGAVNTSLLTNIPVIANVQNAFAFQLKASSYSATATYPLSFTSDSLASSLTIVSQTSGNGSLKIIDASNAIVYADSSMNNKVAVGTQAGRGIPQSITLVFTNYSGTVVFSLARINGH
jgi:hypothetical protein